jgi:hypothetical protein
MSRKEGKKLTKEKYGNSNRKEIKNGPKMKEKGNTT